MYKIVAAVNSMIENTHLIENVLAGKTGYYFLYDKKFKWSIAQNSMENYDLVYYPGDQRLEELAGIGLRYFKDCIQYSTEEIRTKEAIDSFSELYRTVQSKLFKIDDVLDYIINKAA